MKEEQKRIALVENTSPLVRHYSISMTFSVFLRGKDLGVEKHWGFRQRLPYFSAVFVWTEVRVFSPLQPSHRWCIPRRNIIFRGLCWLHLWFCSIFECYLDMEYIVKQRHLVLQFTAWDFHVHYHTPDWRFVQRRHIFNVGLHSQRVSIACGRPGRWASIRRRIERDVIFKWCTIKQQKYDKNEWDSGAKLWHAILFPATSWQTKWSVVWKLSVL